MPIVLAAICYTRTWPLMVLGGLVVLVAGLELCALLSPGAAPFASALFLVLLLQPLSGRASNPFEYAGLAVLTGLGVLAAIHSSGHSKRWLVLFAEWYVAAPVAAIVWLHQAEPRAQTFDFSPPLLLLFLPLWSADVAGILVGVALGKRLLAPSISPKKTVEGGIANLLAATGVAVPLSIWLGYHWTVGLLCGLAIGILGQAGDLFESWLKRRAGVKDSGTLIPGHGGLLDRIDSLLFSAPVVALILINSPRVQSAVTSFRAP